jgi:hypothetical protein
MGIEEGKEVQVKGIGNIFNTIKAEIFMNLKKQIPMQVQEVSRTPNRHEQSRTSPWHIIAKMLSSENKKRILKDKRENNQIIYNGKPIKKQQLFHQKA